MPRLVALALLLVPAAALAADPPLRLNQIQVIGTHNSYHIAPTKDLLATLAALKKETPESLDYTHRPLPEQFGDLGIRQVELDVFADPKGGLYAKPSSRAALLGQKKDAGPDPNKDGVLDKPGFKVLHAQDLDYLSTVPTLAAGLSQIRDWSKKHPTHLPVCVMLELKDETIPLLATQPVKFDAKQLAAVDEAIRGVFDRTHLFTPDDLRGDADSLPKAIATAGWPKLDDVRGKVLFALDNEGGLRNEYLDGHPALKGRVMFVGATDEKHPAAAWFKVNDPIAQGDRIRKLVKAGFLVRTRADADTKEARANDTKRRDAALASGAQFVSTDYPEPRTEWSKYRVTLPDGAVARINPISGSGLKAPAEWEPKR
jgi:Phosphoinositide phospholipase C, Ca2+-dependent